MLLIGLLIATLAISVSPRSQQRLNELLTSISSTVFASNENPDPTARLRIKNWEQTLDLINEKPILGQGYNTLAFIKQNRGQVSSTSVHSASGSDSSLLTILATTGLLGISIYIFIIFSLGLTAYKLAFKSKNLFIKNYGLGYFGALISLQVHSLFVNSQLFAPFMIYFWIATGLLFYYNRLNQEQPLQTHQSQN